MPHVFSESFIESLLTPLALAFCLFGGLGAGLGLPSAQAQPQLVEETFSASPPEPEGVIRYSDGNTTQLCFFALDGEGLFCTDGTTLEQVSSVVPSDPGKTRSPHLAVYENDLYFVGDDGTTGDELWKYDGSSVSLAAEMTPGSGGGNPANLFVYDGALYFAAQGDDGSGLWKYDGSDASFVKAFDDLSSTTLPSGFAVYDDGTSSGADLYFQANDGSGDGTELWRHDGSSTSLVADINGGFSSSIPSGLTVYDDGDGADLYFGADDGSSGNELFRYEDGNSADLVEDINGSGDGLSSGLVVFDGALYFAAVGGTDDEELWKYDGSSSSPSQVKDIDDSGSSSPEEFVVFDDGGMSGADLYFRARAGDGTELYTYDGTSASQVKDIHSGTNNFGDPASSSPRDFVIYNGQLYFVAGDEAGTKLFAYDGSVAAQTFENNIVGGPEEKILYNGDLYFRAANQEYGSELWRFDGNTISRVTDINSGVGDANPSEFIVYDDGSGEKLFFQADDGGEGTELYSYDGSNLNQFVLNSGDEFSDSDPQEFAVYNGVLYFSADGGDKGDELWQYDGSSPERAEDINPDFGSSPSDLVVYDDGSGAKLYFAAFMSDENTEIFSYDGSTLTEETDINTTASDLTVYDDGGSSGTDLYFAARVNSDEGEELWRYDGSGTTLVEDINTSGDARPSDLTVYDDGGSSGPDLYFAARDGSSGEELWRYEESDPSRVRDISSGPGDSSPQDLVVFGDRLYFTARNGSEGREPHVFDGTNVNGLDFNTGTSNGGGRYPATYDDGGNSGTDLYVTATDGSSGAELYRIEKSDPLPVELASFDARLNEDAVRLTWKTASETGNAGFRIERRAAGTVREASEATASKEESWQTVGSIEGNGTTTEPQSYDFVDSSLPYEADQLTYRLVQIDTDGTVNRSKEVTVQRTVRGVKLLDTFPNPADQQATVRYALPERQDVTVRIYDMLGRKVRSVVRGAQEGRQDQRLDVSGLASGVYILRLSAGEAERSQRFTVLH